jgi:hypothetical protein
MLARVRFVWATCALVAALILGVGRSAVAAPLFSLVDRSAVVVRGTVGRVDRYFDDKFFVFTIAPTEVLKGTVAAGGVVRLAQERVFGTESAYFASGAEVLVLAAALPPYSYYRRALPEGSYLQWTDPKDAPRDVAALADPVVVDAVRRYLATVRDVPATARHLATLLGSPMARLRADALIALTDRHDLVATLDASALEPLRAVLTDEHVPLPERAGMLMALARAGAPGIAAIADRPEIRRGPLQAAALDALVVVGKPPGEEQLLAASRASDPALRIAAVRGLAPSSSRAAFDRIAEIVRGDAVPAVRIEALHALGSATDPRAVDILAEALKSRDKGEVQAAADALMRIRSPEAVRALAAALRDGSFDAEAASAFALGQVNRPESVAILREQRDMHPDPHVRRIIKLALGEHLEEHEDE